MSHLKFSPSVKPHVFRMSRPMFPHLSHTPISPLAQFMAEMAEMVAPEVEDAYDPEETPFAYQLELTEMLSAAAEHKVDGNARFKRQDYSSAQRQYTAALKGLASKGDLEADVAHYLATRDPPNAEELAKRNQV